MPSRSRDLGSLGQYAANTYPLISVAAQATTSGTTVTLATNIPSWVRRVTVMLNSISLSGTSVPQIQFGTGSTPTYLTTGYISSSDNYASAAGPATGSTTGFKVGSGSGSAATVWIGTYTFTTLGSNIWVGSLGGAAATTTVLIGGGSVTLPAALSAIRLISFNGTDTFDAGSAAVMYE